MEIPARVSYGGCRFSEPCRGRHRFRVTGDSNCCHDTPAIDRAPQAREIVTVELALDSRYNISLPVQPADDVLVLEFSMLSIRHLRFGY